ncbi:hypothetical protein ACJD0Z_11905 [Flavobacteriaceae bacterium M23B6Z8]
MKYIVTIMITLFFAVGTAFAQSPRQERIKSLKIAFITEKLALTADEAQKFWPIYNTYDDATYQLKNVELKEIKNELLVKGIETISEKEAKSILARIERIESDIYNERKKLVDRLLNVISAKKIILLKKVEDDFNRELLKRLRERRMNRLKNRN